jgi:hypothetical protein
MAPGSSPGFIHEESSEKDVYLKVHTPDLFYGDRKKFKAYGNQVRLYIWSDFKCIRKTLKNATEEMVWVASFFRGDVYARFEPYMEHYLDQEFCLQCDKPV